jgi:acyl carrier protein
VSKALNEIEKKVAEFFVKREGQDVLKVIRNLNFRSDGILDSLDFVSLGVYVERNFGVKLDLTSMETIRLMSTFDSLVKLVQSK